MRHAGSKRAGYGDEPTTVKGVLHPNGPEPRVVYLRRRAAVVTAAAITVLAIVWLATSIGGGSPPPQPAPAAAALTTTSEQPRLSTTASHPTAPDTRAPDAAAPSSPPPAQTTVQRPTPMAPPANGPQLVTCSDDAITVQAQVAAPSYTAGAQPVFRLLITNTGKVACTADLSARLQQLIVYSADGRTRVWSSDDCFPGTAPDTRSLAPAEQAVYSVQWAGTTSTEGCATPRKPAAAGQYVVMGVLGGQQSQPTPFAIA